MVSSLVSRLVCRMLTNACSTMYFVGIAIYSCEPTSSRLLGRSSHLFYSNLSQKRCAVVTSTFVRVSRMDHSLSYIDQADPVSIRFSWSCGIGRSHETLRIRAFSKLQMARQIVNVYERTVRLAALLNHICISNSAAATIGSDRFLPMLAFSHVSRSIRNL